MQVGRIPRHIDSEILLELPHAQRLLRNTPKQLRISDHTERRTRQEFAPHVPFPQNPSSRPDAQLSLKDCICISTYMCMYGYTLFGGQCRAMLLTLAAVSLETDVPPRICLRIAWNTASFATNAPNLSRASDAGDGGALPSVSRISCRPSLRVVFLLSRAVVFVTASSWLLLLSSNRRMEGIVGVVSCESMDPPFAPSSSCSCSPQSRSRICWR